MQKLRALDRRILRNWLPLAFAATIIIGLIYFLSQQSLRLGANDPQIQTAEDLATNLSSGVSPDTLTISQPTDISTSLALFATVFDTNGKVLASTGKLGKQDIALPKGVLAYTKSHGEDRFTWQPTDNVRIAAITRYFKTPNGTSGFVLAGRNLREVEKREGEQLIIAAIAWAITMSGSLALRYALTPKN